MQREESVCGRGNSICKGLAESKRPWGTETLTEHAYLGWKMGAGLSQKRPTREEVLCSIFPHLITSHSVCPIWIRMQNRQPAQDSASSLFPASIIPHSSWLMAWQVMLLMQGCWETTYLGEDTLRCGGHWPAWGWSPGWFFPLYWWSGPWGVSSSLAEVCWRWCRWWHDMQVVWRGPGRRLGRLP